jgi:hypothetical protein
MISAISGLALSRQVTNTEELAHSYGPWSGIRTNHVMSTSGSFFDESGSSRGLSTKKIWIFYSLFASKLTWSLLMR